MDSGTNSLALLLVKLRYAEPPGTATIPTPSRKIDRTFAARYSRSLPTYEFFSEKCPQYGGQPLPAHAFLMITVAELARYLSGLEYEESLIAIRNVFPMTVGKSPIELGSLL